jgi:hypothetical protein
MGTLGSFLGLRRFDNCQVWRNGFYSVDGTVVFSEVDAENNSR